MRPLNMKGFPTPNTAGSENFGSPIMFFFIATTF